MRVMHLIAPGVLAGAERLVLAGCESLTQRGVAVDLVVIEEQRNPAHARAFVEAARARGLVTTTLVSKGRFDLRLMWQVASRARQTSLVHAHGFKALVHAQPAHALRPLVTTWHGDTASDARVRRYERVGHALSSRADRWIVVGRAAHAQALALGARPEVTCVCENFAPDIEGVEGRVRVRGAITRLLFAGRLSEEKAPLVLLEAIAASTVPFELTIAGEGPLLARVQSRVRALGLESRVHLLGWTRDVGKQMDEHDVLVLPSLREGLPLVVLEAAARGMPIVASDVGSIRDVVVEGETGFLVPPGNAQALMNALEATAQSLGCIASRALSLAPAMRQRFGQARWAQETEKIYRDVIASRHPIHANP